MLGQVFTLVVLTPHSLSLYVVIDRLSSCIVGMNRAEWSARVDWIYGWMEWERVRTKQWAKEVTDCAHHSHSISSTQQSAKKDDWMRMSRSHASRGQKILFTSLRPLERDRLFVCSPPHNPASLFALVWSTLQLKLNLESDAAEKHTWNGQGKKLNHLDCCEYKEMRIIEYLWSYYHNGNIFW